VVDYLEGYASSFSAPIREDVGVTALRTGAEGYLVDTRDGVLSARNVVVATGAFQQPRPRVPGVEAAPVELQLTTSEYRHPDQLPEGAVLVVGSGQSGCQIADELLGAGRTVYVSTGRCAWFPRRHRGRDYTHWALVSGLLDETVDSLPSPAARLACNLPISGNDGGHDCHPRWLAGKGATVVGRFEGLDGDVARFAPGVEATLTWGDDFMRTLRRRFDDYIAAQALEVGPPADAERLPVPVPDLPRLDLRESGTSTILWASGFRPDFGWIELDVSDEHGWPVQHRGVSPHPGLYFLGMNWLHKRKSALFGGVGEDAEHVVAQLVAR
jgi:putative flavoprotein involved in K+ transport